MMGRALRFAHSHGHTYLVWPGHGLAVVYRLDDDLIGRPVAAVGYCKDAPLYGLTAEMLPPAQRSLIGNDRFNALFRWADANGDGLVQPDEMTVARVAQTYHGYWGPWIEDDLTLWFPGAGSGVWRVPVESWTPDGVPIYQAPASQRPLFRPLGNCVHAMPSAAGGPGKQSVYVLERHGGNEQTAAGADWMAISRYALDGKRRWAYRRTWTDFALEAPLARPGDVVGAMKFVGQATCDDGLELVAVNGYFGQFNLVSGDGLWVGSLCHDNRYGPKADATTIWPENFSGFFFRSPRDRKFYLLAGDTDARLWEITGLDTLKRAKAPLTLSAADRRLAEAAAAARAAVTGVKPPLRLARRPGLGIDGNLTGWDPAAFTAWDAGGGRRVRAALAYDDNNLYAAFEVRGGTAMINGGKDAALLFKTGDTCEVMLGADPAADPKRTRPAPGDTRLVFSSLGGRPVAVLLQPVAPPGRGGAPRLFSSPTGAEPFARVMLLGDAQVAIVRGGGLYRLEAAVPWRALGYPPAPGASLRGDLGVLFSDPGGSRTVYRSYLFNQDTAIVNDLPSEARLEPAKWGRVDVE
jgi:hypothetical protein